VGCYLLGPDTGGYLPAVIDVLTLEGDKIRSVVGFHTGAEVFARFGLPAELP
jgi:hypothetical protein